LRSAEEKKYVRETGGGSAPPVSIQLTAEDEQLRDLMGISATGLENYLDEDYENGTGK
jgi:hypothetical protein